jgi:hypothetical protein
MVGLVLAISSCGKRSPVPGPLASINLGEELAMAANSHGGRGFVADISQDQASAEHVASFEASEADARRILTALHADLHVRIGPAATGSGHQRDSKDGTLHAAHWTYRFGDKEGVVRMRLIQTGKTRWTIILFHHET